MTLLSGTSVLTDVAGLGDRWAVAWVDRMGIATAKVATVGLDGKVIATRTLGTPALEPRLAAASGSMGVAHLSAGDPARRDVSFRVLTAGLAPAGGERTLNRDSGFDATRSALAWNGTVFGFYATGRSAEMVVVRSEQTPVLWPLDGGSAIKGRTMIGMPGGFAMVAGGAGTLWVRTMSATDGTDSQRIDLPSGTLTAALTRDHTTGGFLGASAGKNVQIFDHHGQATIISDIVGSPDPRLDVLALGSEGGPRTTIVAWTGAGLAGVLYHVSGINTIQMPYFKTGQISGAAPRLWLASASDSVGIFVSEDASSATGETRYFRLKCR